MARLVRADLVDPHEVAAYHCHNRCVRRGFLCGEDPYTGRNYDHRKQWLEKRFEWLAAHFGIDLMGFSILSNHFHVVLRSRPDIVGEWDDSEVARRWLMLCPIRKDERGHPAEPTEAELNMIRHAPQRLEEIRRRLSDISWWMRMASENVARRANREDDVTGHFWEGRFKCVKLCDEAALLACLAYIDLNPIRAGIAETPEASDFTSVQRRIEAQTSLPGRDAFLSPLELDNSQLGALPSVSGKRASDKGCLPLSVTDYLQLVDWTGRQVIRGKRGSIPAALAPILERTGIAGERWLEVVGTFGWAFHRVAGRWQSVSREHPRRNPARTFRAGRCELFDAA